MKNILCFEGEWKFNTHKKPERFDLNSEPILQYSVNSYVID